MTGELSRLTERFLQHAGCDLPVIGGPMYPCSNPELVAAVSEAGGLGVVQPLTLTYVFGYDFREGLRYIRRLTSKPIGMNALIEKSSSRYQQRMQQWTDIALEEGVRFFITSMGKPDWITERVHAAGGVVYHDVTERKWAEKGMDCGVDGLIAVNNRAGGHAGGKNQGALLAEVVDLGLPVICAGGIGNANAMIQALQAGYAGVQLGTRFIATTECSASQAYKQAIVDAKEDDIVLSERITGVPVSVIRTPYVRRVGTKAGPLARWMLRGKRAKYLMRTLYALKSMWQIKQAALAENKGVQDYWQAGKSVAAIERIEPVSAVMHRFRDAISHQSSKVL